VSEFEENLNRLTALPAEVLAGLDRPERPLGVEHRDQLIFLLREAAELEHGIMCQYLFAAFSLKQSADEGVTPEQLEGIGRWRRVVLEVARQEMLHLALVENLLTSIGAAPHLGRPNLPSPARYFPPGVELAFVPFGERALRHFLFLERPEGMPVEDAEGFSAVTHARPLTRSALDRELDEESIVPHPQDFATVGHLYRAIDVGFAWLSAKLGQERLFIGPSAAQAGPEAFRWPSLVKVVDLRTAHAAVDTIVEQGEGVRGNWQTAHFGRFLGVLDEYLAMRDADPQFQPARPVLVGAVREVDAGNLPLIDDPVTARVVDLFDVVNEIVLLALTRYFAATDETDVQRKALAELAVGLMFSGIKPLGERLTRLPFGPSQPDRTAAPAFLLQPQGVALLPHRVAAWAILEERLREAATFARGIQAPPDLGLGRVADALERNASRIAGLVSD
jgi:Ferritin-like